MEKKLSVSLSWETDTPPPAMIAGKLFSAADTAEAGAFHSRQVLATPLTLTR